MWVNFYFPILYIINMTTFDVLNYLKTFHPFQKKISFFSKLNGFNPFMCFFVSFCISMSLSLSLSLSASLLLSLTVSLCLKHIQYLVESKGFLQFYFYDSSPITLILSSTSQNDNKNSVQFDNCEQKQFFLY